MIVHLKGVVAQKKEGAVVLDVNGVGYEVYVADATLARMPGEGGEARLSVVESFGMYGGGTTLYGFADAEEKELFEIFRDNVPSTGAKKALEYLDKAAKSLPDFRRAILEKDAKILAAVFGFSKKTADKLILALKDKLGPVPAHAGHIREIVDLSPSLTQVSSALAALGYRSAEVKAAIENIRTEAKDRSVEELVRLALKKL